MKLEVTDELDSRVFFHGPEEIYNLLRNQLIPELNNVVEGFEKEFFGIALEEEDNIESYILTYVGNYDKLEGVSLKTKRSLNNRDILTLRFSKIIEQEFPKTNQLVTFNTFQSKIKELYETFGILCISGYVAELKNASIILPMTKRGIDYVLLIDILKIYRNIFKRDDLNRNKNNQPKVYLMYDKRLDKVKIGNTRNRLQVRRKGVAESTKRAENPLIELITAWEASKELEYLLHVRCKNKRQRGEWFDLRASDLVEINHITSKYQMVDIET